MNFYNCWSVLGLGVSCWPSLALIWPAKRSIVRRSNKPERTLAHPDPQNAQPQPQANQNAAATRASNARAAPQAQSNPIRGGKLWRSRWLGSVSFSESRRALSRIEWSPNQVRAYECECGARRVSEQWRAATTRQRQRHLQHQRQLQQQQQH